MLQQQNKPKGKQVGNCEFWHLHCLLCLMQLLRLLHSINWSAGTIFPLNSHPVSNSNQLCCSYTRKDNENWTGDVILVNEDEYSLTRRLLVKSMYIQCIFVFEKGENIFFCFHSSDTNVFVFEIQYNYLVLRWPTWYTWLLGAAAHKMTQLTAQKLCNCLCQW